MLPSPAGHDGARDALGRDAELAAIEHFLDSLARQPAGLVIEADIGAGKSTLWRLAVEGARRRGYRVLVARPVESEATLAFAALGDLLRNAIGAAEAALPEPQSRALRVAVLVDDPEGTPPDQLAVSVAALSLLRTLAQDAPVLVAVDDAQWLDAPSARVLEFVLRRLEGERVGLVGTVRRDHEHERADSRFREVGGRPPERLHLGPLGPDVLDEIFRLRLGGSFPRPILAQIASASGGNPLFALEIAQGVQQGTIVAQPGHRLPVPPTLLEFVRDRLDGLPTDARDLLFAAAAMPEPTVGLLARAAIADDARRTLEAAERAAVIEIRGETVSFCHPLFASVLYHAPPIERRRELHRRLATLVSSPHERARHLSLAADGPDAAVAAALDEAARDAAARGAPDAAAELSEQAHGMSPRDDREARDRRRIQAAEYHFAAGDTVRARVMLESLVPAMPPGPARGDVLRRLAKVRYRHDSASAAAELLGRALAEVGPDDLLRAGIERDLAWAVTLCGDVRDAAQHVTSALALVERRPGEPMLAELLAAKAMSEFLLGNGIQADELQRSLELERPRPEVPIEWRPSMILAMILRWSGDIAGACARFDDLHRRAVEAGDETSLPFLLAQLSEAESAAGEWSAALEHAEAAHTLALQTGQEPMRAEALHARALAQAYLGRADDARASARAGLELSQAAGSVVFMLLNQSVLGFVELSVDEPGAAHEVLGPLVNWAEVIGIRDPGILRFVPDEVEALIALGSLDKAAALLEPYATDAARLGYPDAQLAAARARALLSAATGDLGTAARLVSDALERHGRDGRPFELARARLALGSIQRRTRRRAEARASLEAADDAFRKLGARLWAAKAERLLGENGEDRPVGATSSLTPAERRVADLVAGGATNRSAADRLFVSVRAVEVHLTNIYRKLGIRSRTELAALMTREERTPDAGGTP